MDNFTIEEKVGQMFFVGINKENSDDILIKLVKDYKVGGVILYKKNYNNYEEMLKLINKLKLVNKENKIPLFIGIDGEGGRVNRFPAEIHNFKSAYEISKYKNLTLLKNNINVLSTLLKETGININFAPVLDIKRFDNNNYIGDRCYGDNSEDVIKYGVCAMKEYQNNNIIPVIKHFPGSGIIRKDSHYFLSSVNSIKNLTEDMKPFINAINNGAEMIMMEHIIIKDINKKYPIAFSKEFINKIRNDYHYKGIIITDDIKMKSVWNHYLKNNILINLINSNVDIIMFKYKENDENKIIRKTIKLIEKNKTMIKNVDESFKRIINLKNKYKVNDNIVSGAIIDNINKKIDECNRNLDVKKGDK